MAHRVAWSPRAIEDLEAIAQYISADSSAYAATVVKTILRAISHAFPLLVVLFPELGEEKIRECYLQLSRESPDRRSGGLPSQPYCIGDDCWMLRTMIFQHTHKTQFKWALITPPLGAPYFNFLAFPKIRVNRARNSDPTS